MPRTSKKSRLVRAYENAGLVVPIVCEPIVDFFPADSFTPLPSSWDDWNPKAITDTMRWAMIQHALVERCGPNQELVFKTSGKTFYRQIVVVSVVLKRDIAGALFDTHGTKPGAANEEWEADGLEAIDEAIGDWSRSVAGIVRYVFPMDPARDLAECAERLMGKWAAESGQSTAWCDARHGRPMKDFKARDLCAFVSNDDLDAEGIDREELVRAAGFIIDGLPETDDNHVDEENRAPIQRLLLKAAAFYGAAQSKKTSLGGGGGGGEKRGDGGRGRSSKKREEEAAADDDDAGTQTPFERADLTNRRKVTSPSGWARFLVPSLRGEPTEAAVETMTAIDGDEAFVNGQDFSFSTNFGAEACSRRMADREDIGEDHPQLPVNTIRDRASDSGLDEVYAARSLVACSSGRDIDDAHGFASSPSVYVPAIGPASFVLSDPESHSPLRMINERFPWVKDVEDSSALRVARRSAIMASMFVAHRGMLHPDDREDIVQNAADANDALADGSGTARDTHAGVLLDMGVEAAEGATAAADNGNYIDVKFATREDEIKPTLSGMQDLVDSLYELFTRTLLAEFGQPSMAALAATGVGEDGGARRPFEAHDLVDAVAGADEEAFARGVDRASSFVYAQYCRARRAMQDFAVEFYCSVLSSGEHTDATGHLLKFQADMERTKGSVYHPYLPATMSLRSFSESQARKPAIFRHFEKAVGSEFRACDALLTIYSASARLPWSLPCNYYLAGDQSGGKSFGVDIAQSCSVPGLVFADTSGSKQANFGTGGNMDDTVVRNDENQAYLTSSNPTPDESEQREAFKTITTSGIAVRRVCQTVDAKKKGALGKRVMVRYWTRALNQSRLNTSNDTVEKKSAVRSRFYFPVMDAETKSSDAKREAMVNSLFANDVSDARVDEHRAAFQSKHCLLVHVCRFIRNGVLHMDTSVLSAALRHYLRSVPMLSEHVIRACLRLFTAGCAYTVEHAVDTALLGPLSPHFRRERGGAFEADRFEMRHVLAVEPYLKVTAEIATFALTRYADDLSAPSAVDTVRKVAKVLGVFDADLFARHMTHHAAVIRFMEAHGGEITADSIRPHQPGDVLLGDVPANAERVAASAAIRAAEAACDAPPSKRTAEQAALVADASGEAGEAAENGPMDTVEDLALVAVRVRLAERASFAPQFMVNRRSRHDETSAASRELEGTVNPNYVEFKGTPKQFCQRLAGARGSMGMDVTAAEDALNNLSGKTVRSRRILPFVEDTASTHLFLASMFTDDSYFDNDAGVEAQEAVFTRYIDGQAYTYVHVGVFADIRDAVRDAVTCLWAGRDNAVTRSIVTGFQHDVLRTAFETLDGHRPSNDVFAILSDTGAGREDDPFESAVVHLLQVAKGKAASNAATPMGVIERTIASVCSAVEEKGVDAEKARAANLETAIDALADAARAQAGPDAPTTDEEFAEIAEDAERRSATMDKAMEDIVTELARAGTKGVEVFPFGVDAPLVLHDLRVCNVDRVDKFSNNVVPRVPAMPDELEEAVREAVRDLVDRDLYNGRDPFDPATDYADILAAAKPTMSGPAEDCIANSGLRMDGDTKRFSVARNQNKWVEAGCAFVNRVARKRRADQMDIDGEGAEPAPKRMPPPALASHLAALARRPTASARRIANSMPGNPSASVKGLRAGNVLCVQNVCRGFATIVAPRPACEDRDSGFEPSFI